MTGITSNVKIVVVIIPPTIGAAIRFITSAPVPWLHIIGSNPRKMAEAVITTGRTRRIAPSTMASTRLVEVHCSLLSLRRRIASSRKTTMMTPISAATPARAIIPTQTATLKL